MGPMLLITHSIFRCKFSIKGQIVNNFQKSQPMPFYDHEVVLFV